MQPLTTKRATTKQSKIFGDKHFNIQPEFMKQRTVAQDD
jgi:hypothetical protein